MRSLGSYDRNALAGDAVAAATTRRLMYAKRSEQGRFAPIVSINRTAALTGEGPGLAGLVDQHAVEISEAQGRTVLRARTDRGPSRQQLCEVRQLVETGEVLRVEGQPHGTRKPLGTVLERVGRVANALRELTAGRGPRCCIEAVGMEGHSAGPLGYDLFKHKKEGCLRAVFFPQR